MKVKLKSILKHSIEGIFKNEMLNFFGSWNIVSTSQKHILSEKKLKYQQRYCLRIITLPIEMKSKQFVYVNGEKQGETKGKKRKKRKKPDRSEIEEVFSLYVIITKNRERQICATSLFEMTQKQQQKEFSLSTCKHIANFGN